MKKSDRKRNIPMRAAGGLLCFTMASIWLVSGLYARFTTGDSGGDEARVAAFVFVVDDEAQSRIVDISGVKKPGDTQSYTFVVQNSSGSTVSEVAEAATVTLSLNGSLPLTCTVAEGTDNKASVTENGGTAAVTQSGVLHSFDAALELNKTYTLTVAWPDTANDIEYASAGAISKLVMTVTGTQID